MKPICVPCQRFYRPRKNGIAFVEGAPAVNGAEAGTITPHLWRPYKLWYGDLWRCRGCGAQIVVGTGRRPIAEQHDPDFLARIASHNAVLQINDC